MDRAVRDGVFPGAVLAVRQAGELRFLLAAGRVSTDPPGDAVQPSTIYDLASLTKPLVTVTSILLLLQAGKLELGEAVQSVLPELSGFPVGSTTISDLLTHSSGLPGWRPLYERLEAGGLVAGETPSATLRQAVLQLIRDEPLIYGRGERSLYSDLGFILLGLAVERLAGVSLDAYFEAAIAAPLQARPLLYSPLEPRSAAPPIDASRIAPSERVERKGRCLRGEVHDDNAASMGGVAGHAGLFGTAEAVLCVSGAWLRAHGGEPSLLDHRLVREFTRRQAQIPQSSWALGWDTPSVSSSSGSLFSPESFGHLGYTGTSLWIDPLKELEVVLLSNRVHPTRRNEQIKTFRPLIHDLAVRESGVLR